MEDLHQERDFEFLGHEVENQMLIANRGCWCVVCSEIVGGMVGSHEFVCVEEVDDGIDYVEGFAHGVLSVRLAWRFTFIGETAKVRRCFRFSSFDIVFED